MFWLCTGCKEWIKNNSIVNLNNKIDTFSDNLPNVKNLMDSMSTILKETHADMMENLSAKIVLCSNLAKQSNGDSIIPNAQRSVEPTPTDSSTIGANGSKSPPLPQLNITSICGTKNIVTAVKTVSPKYWLYLSQFDPQTTEIEISSMLKECLGIDDAKIVKLIPKGREQCTLSFIAFKVGIGAEWRTAALNPENWPTGVFVRQFTDNRTNFRYDNSYRLSSQAQRS